MLVFLGSVCASWSGREDLSLSLSSFPAPHLLGSPRPVPGWADSLIHGNITGYFPGVENETISNLDITQSQVRFAGLCVCMCVVVVACTHTHTHMCQIVYSPHS